MSLRRNGLSSPAEGASLARVLFPLTGRFDCCGLLVCLGELYAGEGKAQSPQKKRKTPDHAKQRSAPPRYSASCLKTSCMPNSRLPFWAGQTRQRCGAPGPGRPRTPWSGTAVPRQQAGVAAAALHRAPPAAGAAAGVCSAGSAPLSAPGAGAGKGARGKGAGAVSGPSLSYRQRRLRSGQKVAGGMVRGGGCTRAEWMPGSRRVGRTGAVRQGLSASAGATQPRVPSLSGPPWPRKNHLWAE